MKRPANINVYFSGNPTENPSVQEMILGEIAVKTDAGSESLWIRNNKGSIVKVGDNARGEVKWLYNSDSDSYTFDSKDRLYDYLRGKEEPLYDPEDTSTYYARIVNPDTGDEMHIPVVSWDSNLPNYGCIIDPDRPPMKKPKQLYDGKWIVRKHLPLQPVHMLPYYFQNRVIMEFKMSVRNYVTINNQRYVYFWLKVDNRYKRPYPLVGGFGADAKSAGRGRGRVTRNLQITGPYTFDNDQFTYFLGKFPIDADEALLADKEPVKIMFGLYNDNVNYLVTPHGRILGEEKNIPAEIEGDGSYWGNIYNISSETLKIDRIISKETHETTSPWLKIENGKIINYKSTVGSQWPLTTDEVEIKMPATGSPSQELMDLFANKYQYHETLIKIKGRRHRNNPQILINGKFINRRPKPYVITAVFDQNDVVIKLPVSIGLDNDTNCRLMFERIGSFSFGEFYDDPHHNVLNHSLEVTIPAGTTSHYTVPFDVWSEVVPLVAEGVEPASLYKVWIQYTDGTFYNGQVKLIPETSPQISHRHGITPKVRTGRYRNAILRRWKNGTTVPREEMADTRINSHFGKYRYLKYGLGSSRLNDFSILYYAKHRGVPSKFPCKIIVRKTRGAFQEG